MPDWRAIFDPSLPVLEILARGTAIYLGLLLMLRIVGQREAGAIGLHDLLVLVLIAEAAGNALGQYETIPDGLMIVATILAWSVAIDAVAWRWPRLGRLLKPRPRPLIEDGILNAKVLRRELMTKDEVLSQLRLHGIDDISKVKRAYIEPNGMISVLREDDGEVEAPEPQTAI
jgi:uncharacterized membrane protein YcaP (DUF421 family)